MQYPCMSFTMKALAAAAFGVTLERPHDYAIRGYVLAAASARREAVLWLPCRPGENTHACTSYGSSSLLPAS